MLLGTGAVLVITTVAPVNVLVLSLLAALGVAVFVVPVIDTVCSDAGGAGTPGGRGGWGTLYVVGGMGSPP